MADQQSTQLTITHRERGHSRATRRLRREGLVPGVLYGGGGEPVPFQVAERELRHALHASGAVVELALDGKSTPAVLKDQQVHPVRGTTLHVDFLRVRLDQAISAVTTLELVGAAEAPGAKEGGVLEHVSREVNIEALPNDIPESISVDVSQMQIGDTVTLAAVTPPQGVTFLDDLDETVVATLTPPRLRLEDEEGIEEETEVIGEGGAPAEAAEEGGEAGEAPSE